MKLLLEKLVLVEYLRLELGMFLDILFGVFFKFWFTLHRFSLSLCIFLYDGLYFFLYSVFLNLGDFLFNCLGRKCMLMFLYDFDVLNIEGVGHNHIIEKVIDVVGYLDGLGLVWRIA